MSTSDLNYLFSSDSKWATEKTADAGTNYNAFAQVPEDIFNMTKNKVEFNNKTKFEKALRMDISSTNQNSTWLKELKFDQDDISVDLLTTPDAELITELLELTKQTKTVYPDGDLKTVKSLDELFRNTSSQYVERVYDVIFDHTFNKASSSFALRLSDNARTNIVKGDGTGTTYDTKHRIDGIYGNSSANLQFKLVENINKIKQKIADIPMTSKFSTYLEQAIQIISTYKSTDVQFDKLYDIRMQHLVFSSYRGFFFYTYMMTLLRDGSTLNAKLVVFPLAFMYVSWLLETLKEYNTDGFSSFDSNLLSNKADSVAGMLLGSSTQAPTNYFKFYQETRKLSQNNLDLKDTYNKQVNVFEHQKNTLMSYANNEATRNRDRANAEYAYTVWLGVTISLMGIVVIYTALMIAYKQFGVLKTMLTPFDSVLVKVFLGMTITTIIIPLIAAIIGLFKKFST